MQKPIIIFFGNTKYSKLGLQVIAKTFPISLIITNFGSPVKQFGDFEKIPVLETKELNRDILAKISLKKPDFLIVEDYGLILPDKLLELPRYAPLNIHHSLLPKYRGPSPAPTAILNAEKISGVTIINMSGKVDAGDILAQKEYELTSTETADTLLIKLNEIGGKLIVGVIKQYLVGGIHPKKQDQAQATQTKFLIKTDGYFDIENPPAPDQLDRIIRAYYPWPTVWTRWNGKIVKFYPERKIQMEGKKIISLKDFLNGYPNFPMKIMQPQG